VTEQITEHINYQKGYDQGYSDAQEYLAKKFDKILSKNANQSYEKGFREGADQKNNKPCVCGFWGEEKKKK
tara:strand:- start:21143 stop:21355 length:213 start_codon:yes stop_codon:yes gene_type:complete